VFSLHIDMGRRWGGGQNQVRYLVMGLRATGHRAALVAEAESELFRRMSEGVDLIPLAHRSEIDLAAAWRLSRVIRQLAPDVVHAHDPHAVALAATALSMTTMRPCPVLVASRRLEFRMARNSFSRWKYGQVHCFVANSVSVRDRLVTEGIQPERTAVVIDGVDVDRIAHVPAASVHAEFFLPTHVPIVGNVASLVPHKGHHHLIEAAALVLHDVPDARFVIVGDGELRPSLEQQIHHKHLERHVLLAGFRPDALELTKGVDVFAVSSIHEGLCTALVDAMAAGKPAVATRAGGIPEVVVDGKTGFIVPTRDPKAMAKRLVQLLRDEPLRERMGAAAERRARDMFTVERMVEQTAALYARLVAGRSRRRAG
jgi:L-malate glycosyltransferase